MAFEGDLERFFNASEFGEAITVKGTQVSAICDVTPMISLGMSGWKPSVTCQSASLPDPLVQGDTVVVKGMTYKLASQPEPDGEGVTVLRLEKVRS